MKKILIVLLALTMCFSFFACGSQDSESSDKGYLSLEELVSDPEFQQIFTDMEDDMFTYSVSASDENTFVFEANAKKTYKGDDLDFLTNLTTEEIAEKFDLAGLKDTLKDYGFGDVTVVCKINNGDGSLITERTIE